MVQRWRWLAVPAALALIGVLLALPTPHAPSAASGAAAPAAAGPDAVGPIAAVLPSLTAVWPAARPASFPGPPNGSTLRPVLALSPTAAVGVATSADGTRASLVVLAGKGPPRVVQAAAGG